MSIAKTFGTLSLTAMGLLNAADATAQDTKTASKPEPDKVVKFITNENNGNEATLVSKSTNAELAGRARVEAANSNKITQQDTPLAETVEAIAAEVSEYGLLQTRQEKLDFAKKAQESVDYSIKKGLPFPTRAVELYVKALQWLKSSKRDSLFDKENGYTRNRLIEALIKSPSFSESYGSLATLAKGEANVQTITLHNERLISEQKVASIETRSPDKDFAINR